MWFLMKWMVRGLRQHPVIKASPARQAYRESFRIPPRGGQARGRVR